MAPGRPSSGSASMSFLEHLAELRRLLIVSVIGTALCAVVAFLFYDAIIDFLYKPLEALENDPQGNLLFVNTLLEGFVTRMKISVLGGLIVSFPLHVFNALRFILPALTRKEKSVLCVSLLCSFAFVVGAFFYSYYQIIPISVHFLTADGFIPERTGMLLGFTGNIMFVLQFMFVALIVFQLPIVVEVLLAMNVVRRRTLLRISRYVIVAIFVLAAVVTPPDFVTQLSLAIPLTGMYFLTIGVAKIFGFGGE